MKSLNNLPDWYFKKKPRALIDASLWNFKDSVWVLKIGEFNGGGCLLQNIASSSRI